MRRNQILSLTQCVTLVVAGFASANSGVQLPLDQYQAGTETTDNSLIVNAGFEQPGVAGPNATGWTAISNSGGTPSMSVGVPDSANLPSNPAVLGNFSAKASVANRNFNDQYEQNVTFAPDTDYVISGYIWNYGFAGPAPANDLFAGDLAVLQLRDVTNFNNTAGVILEPVRFDEGPGSRGVFIYKTFNSSQFPNGATLEVQSDPNEDIFGTRPSIVAQFDNIALTPVKQFKSQAWTSGTSGNWGDNSRWQNRQANAIGAVANFANQAGPVTVTLDDDKVVAAMTFDSAGGYTIGGTKVLGLWHDEDRATVLLNVLQGNHTIAAPITVVEPSTNGLTAFGPRQVHVDIAESSTLSLSNNMVASGPSSFRIVKKGLGTLAMKNVRANRLTINDGTVKVIAGASPDSTSNVKSFVLNDGGHLDISNTVFIVDYAPEETSPIAQYRVEAAGGGIRAGSPTNNLVVGFVEASALGGSTHFGQTLDSTAVLMISTFRGDSNLDRDVDFDDLLLLAQNYGATNMGFEQGDNNYDGNINFDDLLALAQNYGQAFALRTGEQAQSPTGSFASDWALARTMVPEPSVAGLLLAGSLATRRRR